MPCYILFYQHLAVLILTQTWSCSHVHHDVFMLVLTHTPSLLSWFTFHPQLKEFLQTPVVSHRRADQWAVNKHPSCPCPSTPPVNHCHRRLPAACLWYLCEGGIWHILGVPLGRWNVFNLWWCIGSNYKTHTEDILKLVFKIRDLVTSEGYSNFS